MFREIISVLLSVILIPILIVGFLLLNIRVSLLNPNFYKATLQRADIYNQIFDEALPGLLSATGGMDAATMFAPLTAEDLGSILKQSLQPEWLKEQVDGLFDGLFNYISGRTPNIGVKIELGEKKEELATNFVNAYNEKWKSAPTCTAAELQKLKQTPAGSVPNLTCKPAGTSIDKIDKEILTGKDGLLSNLPDEIDLDQTLAGAAGASPVATVQQAYGYAQIALIIAISLIILLLAVIAAINHRPITRMLNWVAVPPLIVSSLFFFVSLIGDVAVFNVVATSLVANVTPTLKPLLHGLIRALFGTLFLNFLISSGIVLGLSIAALVTAKVIGAKAQPQTPPAKVENQTK